MIWLWDKQNDSPEILGDDGEFYFYGEDDVVINKKNYDGRYWTKLNKFQDVTPLNDCQRFDILDPITGEWVWLYEAGEEIVKYLHRAAKDPDWENATI